jgi:multidrug resistance efflux pump
VSEERPQDDKPAEPAVAPEAGPEPGPDAASVRQQDPLESPEEVTPKARGWAPPKSGPRLTVLFVVVLLACALLALYAWDLPPFHSAVQTTDNAFVRGQTTVIAPQVSGYVTKVYVQDFEQVEAGAPLVQIDDRIYRQRVEQAQATVQAQLATLANSQQ